LHPRRQRGVVGDEERARLAAGRQPAEQPPPLRQRLQLSVFLRLGADRHPLLLSPGHQECDADAGLPTLTLTPLEIAAVAFTLVNVWLAVKENIWCWPFGIVGVVLYAVVNYQAKFYANAGLQIVYLVLSIHGWYEWLHGGVNRTELRMSAATARQWRACM